MPTSHSNAIASSSSTHIRSKPPPPKHQDLVLSQDESSSEDSDETEDEDGAELTPAMDAAILRTLAKIKKKEGVYGSENILQNELQKTALQAERLHLTRKVSQKKAFTLQDHQRLALLNSDPTLNEDIFVPPETTIPLTNVQEERLLRKEVTAAFHSAVGENGKGDDEEEEEVDGFLKVIKDGEKVDEDKEAYRKFLLESGGGEDAVREILGLGERVVVGNRNEESEEGEEGEGIDEEKSGEKKRKNKKVKKMDVGRSKEEDDEFLMNYILNRGWVDTDAPEASSSKAGRAAAFESADEDEDEQQDGGGGTSHPWGALEEEDEFDEKAEEFETAYNFRFEEPGAAEIPSHPRILSSVVRRPDETRKTKRQARLERKAAEKLARDEETRRLKGEKRREIEKRLEQLRREVGEKALEGLDLDKDWDEEEHDRMMGRMMAQDGDDEEKPSWGEDEGEYPEYPEEEGEVDGEEGGYTGEVATGVEGAEEMDVDQEGPINMDADFIAFPDERKEKKKKRKEKKRKNKENRVAAEEDDDINLEAEQGLSVEAKKEKVKQALEEYKSLDHHGDMIGDMPTRFKYAQTAPVSYGLTPAEILLATEAELNAYIGLKHFVPYRDPNNLGAAGRGMHKRLQDLKRKLATRRWGEEVPVNDEEEEKKDSGWKGKMRVNSAVGGGTGEPPRKKKRMGKKERTKLALRTGGEGEGA